MSFKADTGVFRWPSVLLLAATLLFCFIPGAGSVTAQTGDDHGNDFNAATSLALGSSTTGRIDPGSDRDVFKLDLSGTAGPTHVWIHTTGGLDTRGWLYDHDGSRLTGDDNTTSDGVIVETNFRIPRTLAPGVYYISVRNADGVTTGDYTVHAMADDHGNYFAVATALALGGSAAGRIEPGFDRDVFELDLSGTAGITDVWIYTTGGLDTRGWLYDSDGNRLTSNNNSHLVGRELEFQLRRRLSSGVYYISVRSWSTSNNDNDTYDTGDYALHAEAVTDPGGTPSTATNLNLDEPAPGTVDAAGDADHFRLDLASPANLVVQANNPFRRYHTSGEAIPRGDLYVAMLDSQGTEIPVNIRDDRAGTRGIWIADSFGPGTYHVKVTAPYSDTTYPVPYTIQAHEDTAYGTFIDGCENATLSLASSQVGDP